MIRVSQIDAGDDPMVFRVVVHDANGETQHRVRMTQATYRKLTDGKVSPTDSITAVFEYLLEREPKEEILPSFDITVIQMYFPSFEEDFPAYIARKL